MPGFFVEDDSMRSVFLLLCLALNSTLLAQVTVRATYFPGLQEGRPDISPTPIPETLKALCASVTDATSQKGGLSLSKTDLLVIGSWATSSPEQSILLCRSAEAISSFVRRGGVCLVFPQYSAKATLAADLAPELKGDAREPMAMFEPDLPLKSTPQYLDEAVVLEPEHPLVSTPNRIDTPRINGWNGPWAVQTDSYLALPNARVIAGHRYKIAFPYLAEVVIGKGRVIVLSSPVDCRQPSTNDRSQTLCADILANTVAYVTALREKTAPPFKASTLEWPPATTKDAVIDYDDYKGFTARVNTAVDRGVVALRSMQKPDGSFGDFRWGYQPNVFPVGQTCLSVLALLSSGVQKSDPAITKAVEFVIARPPKSTYECGLAAMMLEHLAAPEFERFEIARMTREQRRSHVFVRNLKPDHKTAMAGCVAWLMDARYRGVWSYLAGNKTADLSNTQYGALGLLAARRCGFEIPPEAFSQFIDVLLRSQGDGRGTRSYAVPLTTEDPPAWPKFEMRNFGVSFWNYHPLERATSGRGTMDLIGITMLLLGVDGLGFTKATDPRSAKIRDAIDRALNHLDSQFRVDKQPAGETTLPDYYYLYALERTMVLADARFVGRHDWYREAAEFLCDIQRKDGRWDSAGNQNSNDPVNTSFALLTLRRATVPSRTTLSR